MEPTGRANARPMTGSAQSIRAEKIPEFASLRPGYGFKKIAKAASLASNARRQQEGKHRETRRRVLLRQRALCGRGRADDKGAVPLPRMPIYFGRRSQHVCADAARWLQIYKGQPEEIRPQRSGRPVTREFCAECGTHMVTRPQVVPAVVLKVGTLDDPTLFEGPKMAIYTVDKQPFHMIPEGLPAFERLPQRK